MGDETVGNETVPLSPNYPRNFFHKTDSLYASVSINGEIDWHPIREISANAGNDGAASGWRPFAHLVSDNDPMSSPKMKGFFVRRERPRRFRFVETTHN